MSHLQAIMSQVPDSSYKEGVGEDTNHFNILAFMIQ